MIIATGDPDANAPAPLRDDLDAGVDVTEDPRSAVEALTSASHTAGLLVLGSRHPQGVLARLSVSERTARARCPVLVLR